MKRRIRLLGGFVGMVLMAGCVQMPAQGPVVEVEGESTSQDAPRAAYDPKPPQPGESATEIVSNFLEAMTAIPITTSVAQQFLTAEAQRQWEPDRSIITYDDFSSPTGQFEVAVEMSDLEEYDERGAWQRSRSDRTIRFGMATEDGEWRINELPDALVVPTAWFADWYRRVSLYYFDPTAQVLVPEPAFVPDGEQSATALVRGLLTSPSGGPLVSQTALPAGFRAPPVPVAPSGVAEVSLVGDAGLVDDVARQRILTQLVWTMRQDERIRAVQLSIGDADAEAEDPAQVTLDVGQAYDPSGAQASTDLFGLVDGLLVRGPGGSLLATAGPLGTERLGVRSIAVNLEGSTVAGISGDGTSLMMAPVDAAGRADVVLSGAVDLLAPAWDFADRVWLADRRPDGALIMVVNNGRRRILDVPGISGRNVRRILVSRDGSRLVAVVRTPDGDRVVASRIQHDGRRVSGATPAQILDFGKQTSGLVVRDIGWRSPTSVSVIADIDRNLSQLSTVSADGAPGDLNSAGVSLLRGGVRIRTLVTSPVTGLRAFAVAGLVPIDLSAPERQLSELPEGLTYLTYVG